MDSETVSQILSANDLVKKTEHLLRQAQVECNIHPKLVVLIIGQYEPSWIYVKAKTKIAQSLGIDVELVPLSEMCSQQRFEELCEKYSNDRSVHGVFIQLPLPYHLNIRGALSKISPMKDVDGLHPYNQGLLLTEDQRGLTPCTPLGVMRLLKYYDIPLIGKNALIIGRSILVGKPLSICLLNAHATPTIAHSKTTNLESHLGRADLIILATGVQNVISLSQLQPHQVVIDVGIHRGRNGKIHGDLGPIDPSQIPCSYSPVPGGVGPMTINSLMYNIFSAYFMQNPDDRWLKWKSAIDSCHYTS